ncbi:hypothetical protein CSUI_005174 [Cystoisospora suis]|uniref:Uncharacterized protein n=1 Tax=Cystoisospora suis TaxID=483139 RepID=A0A2C6KUQ2_9APIC|nr:hypothetical protein CSUI_005174 [Cystoisospora suis]
MECILFFQASFDGLQSDSQRQDEGRLISTTKERKVSKNTNKDHSPEVSCKEKSQRISSITKTSLTQGKR